MTNKTLKEEEQINRTMILDKNEDSEKILTIYPDQKKYLFGMLGGFLNTFKNGKKNKILYCGKIEDFNGLNNPIEKNEIIKNNKEISYIIKQLDGNKDEYMSILEYFNNPEKGLDEILFKEAKELVKNKKAELKGYLGDATLFLSYKGNLYFRNELKRAYSQ